MPIVNGKAMWASILKPNTTYEPVYTINVVVDSDTADKFQQAGYTIKNRPVSWSDDDMPQLVVKRKVNGPGLERSAPDLISNLRDTETGQWIPLAHFKVIKNKFNGDVDKYIEARNDGYNIEDDARSLNVNVGNGSEVSVQYKEWETNRSGQTYKGLDLLKVQVTKLVEYEPDDVDEFAG